MNAAKKVTKPRSLKVYTWRCGLADGGYIAVLAHDVNEARALVRKAHETSSIRGNIEAAILAPADINRSPHVISC